MSVHFLSQNRLVGNATGDIRRTRRRIWLRDGRLRAPGKREVCSLFHARNRRTFADVARCLLDESTLRA